MARSMERQWSPSRARERDLVLAFQAGDRAAYEHIDRECRPAAERICRRLLINPADVEEAVQETMLRAYQGLPRFNGSYALTAWVARIATNVCLDTLRARSRRPQTAAAIEPNMEARNGENGNGHRDPEELVEEMAAAEEVRRVLAELPERHRTALVLREFEGYSHRKIAEMLDTSPARVKALIHRAKAGFRRAWRTEHPGRIAAFAPLLAPIQWLRRFVGRGPELDLPASTAASATQLATMTSSPASQTFLGIASDRVAGTMATVLVAGTMGFAVQNAPIHSGAAEEPAPVEITEVAEPVEAPAPPKVEKEPKKERPAPEEPEPSPSPTEVSPSPSPSPSVQLEGGAAPEIGRPAQPKPTLPPHPAGFSFSFSSDRTSSSRCGCGGTPSVRQDSLVASKDGFTSFDGAVLGAALRDSSGAPAWAIDEVKMRVLLERIDLYFEVNDDNGTSIFEASALQSSVEQNAWGGWTIAYVGTYHRRGGPVEHAELPVRGRFNASVTFSWREQRAVAAYLQFTEG